MVLIACRDCAIIQKMPASLPRGRLECCRCGRVLENTNGRSLDAGLACAMTTLLLLVPANLLPVMTLHLGVVSRSTHLGSGLVTAWRQDWPLLTIVLALQAVILPFVRFGLLTVTLLGIRGGARGPWVGTAFRYCEMLDPWAMADVLLIGAGIGYGRVASQLPVRIDAGGWCFVVAAMMTMLTRATLERRAVWRWLQPTPDYSGPDAIACSSCDLVLPPEADGQRCPRCTASIRRRNPSAVSRTTALLLAAALLTPVAYAFPMSEFWEAGTPHPHTVIDGIELLFENGFWYFGVIIFFVSLAFPLTKLVALSWFLVSIWRRSPSRLRLKTQLYRFVDDIGRWSTLDPFTVIIFAPMLQFQQLAHINVMGGSPAFLATVVLSMLAARTFDPRLMWDAGEARSDAQAAVPAPQGMPLAVWS